MYTKYGEKRFEAQAQSTRAVSRFVLLGDLDARYEEPVVLPLVGLTYSSRGLNFRSLSAVKLIAIQSIFNFARTTVH